MLFLAHARSLVIASFLTFVTSLLLAGSAAAVSIWAQVKTTSKSPILANKTITAEVDFGSIFGISGDIQNGGLSGDPYLEPWESISFSFELPDKVKNAQIKDAWLFVVAYDDVDKICGRTDYRDEAKEYALVKLYGEDFKMFEVDGMKYWPEIVAGGFDVQGGSVDGLVKSKGGDFKVAAVGVKVKYEPAIPEPSAALVFGAGALLVTQARRRSLRRR